MGHLACRVYRDDKSKGPACNTVEGDSWRGLDGRLTKKAQEEVEFPHKKAKLGIGFKKD